jgi:hypothetical protein
MKVKSSKSLTKPSKNAHTKKPQTGATRADFTMQFDIGTIKHLGLQMYSTLPPVIGELVSNAWDADADEVEINIPVGQLDENSEITVIDNGSGMSDQDVRNAYLVVGRDRRKEEGDHLTPKYNRKLMGRKGIGKFSAFGIANEIEVETVKDGEVSRFIMNYKAMEKAAGRHKINMPPLAPTGTVEVGTKVTLRDIGKYRRQGINIQNIRRGLARRFSIIGAEHNFEVIVNGAPITHDERDLKRLLDKDTDGALYIWNYNDQEIKRGFPWKVSGWIGALDRTNTSIDGIQRGIVVMARGKLVQEPFVFEATVGQQYALSYIVGELHAEFVDEAVDTIGTTRSSLVWDTEANTAFKEWGQKEVNRIAREWALKRSQDNARELAKNPVYKKFTEEAEQFENKHIRRVADNLIKEMVEKNPLAEQSSQEKVVQFCLDFMQINSFQELAEEITRADVEDVSKLVELFREWEIVEAKEMMRVTEGRITTIEKLERLIETNALEVPTLHNFLKEFPWVIDPRWTLIADEQRYSQLLRDKFPEDADTPPSDRRIDFLCVKESTNLVVIEIKRPALKASRKELDQIEEYVLFMRDYVSKTTDPDMKYDNVVGYLLCGDLVDTPIVRGRRTNLAASAIYVRLYGDLLEMAKNLHREFLSRYDKLRQARKKQLA